MASELPSMSVNGYAQQQTYGSMDATYNAYPPAPSQTTPHVPSTAPNGTAATATPAAAAAAQSDVPKDEVGWYFVEQYYTTLSRNPEKLYLFYNKRSQFVSGQETDKVAVCVGQRAINDRIKELDFQDCKVRVTNVDSQASDANIVIQVIGEISNKSQPHQKFTQTFVLAAQVNGYFVLNDIFRYLIEEEEEQQQEEQQQIPPVATEETSAPQESVSAAEEPELKTLPSSGDPAAIERSATQVDRELEEKVSQDQPASYETAAPVNGVAAEESTVHAEDAPAAATATEIKEETLQPEKPKDPEPTPAASPLKQAPPQPAAPAKPAAPKTWAGLLAANAAKTPAPAVPAQAPAATPNAAPKAAQPATKPAAPAAAAAAVSAPAAQAALRDPSPATATDDEWTAVGSTHNRQQSRQVNAQQPEVQQHRGYIKNVHEGIDGSQLKAALEKVAEVTYFDISRQKNCAFVDFKTADGYTAAVAANPFSLNGEQLYVEERRMRSGAPQFGQRGNFGGRGRGGHNNPGAPRGNFQGGGGRGGFTPRGRGAQSTPRGRGGAQAA